MAINGFSMVLLPLNHHHWIFFHWLTIDINGFPMVFTKVWHDGQQWFWPVKRPKKRLQLLHFEFFPQINLMKAKGDKWISQIMSKFPCHFADWRKNLNFWTFKNTICYHCKVSMVFKGTITIEWNGLGQPLGSMVFQWFWGHATIGFDGLRWLSTIGPTMEWLHTIVEV